ncbi:uncharacterized protein LOC124456345 isoform X2 [Xenia sp. Carnegie-2017]|uniref:uncharacterized protein LOC124456345 isoform X2 n=1 Tax=Xenia sp. Carnegie-2017 TaxID=2897299 RepID=UPI001F045A24|nr:uncharacterized protein LOC124456345 isoform X2 [Xenia sp. Carnegie-2017]
MFCTVCGNSLNTSGNFCANCGTDLRKSDESKTLRNSDPSTSAGPSTDPRATKPLTFKEYLADISFATVEKRKRQDLFVSTKKGKKDETVKVMNT